MSIVANSKENKTEIPPKKTYNSIIIIGALFFIFGFVTWLNSLLIPYLEIACELTKFQSFFVTFAFYIAYVVMAPISTRTLTYYTVTCNYLNPNIEK